MKIDNEDSDEDTTTVWKFSPYLSKTKIIEIKHDATVLKSRIWVLIIFIFTIIWPRFLFHILRPPRSTPVLAVKSSRFLRKRQRMSEKSLDKENLYFSVDGISVDPRDDSEQLSRKILVARERLQELKTNRIVLARTRAVKRILGLASKWLKKKFFFLFFSRKKLAKKWKAKWISKRLSSKAQNVFREMRGWLLELTTRREIFNIQTLVMRFRTGADAVNPFFR